jgi:hypothetical protein
MSGFRQYISLWWRGQGSSTKICSVHTADNPAAELGAAGGIVTASQAMSVAGLEAVQVIPSLFYGDSPGSGPYQSCRDYVILKFACEDGGILEYTIPAPDPAYLTGPGLSLVDGSHGLVVALTDALISGGANSSGSPVVSFRRGSRYRYSPREAF